VPPDTEFVSNWTFSREVQTGKVALTSYDFERPSTALLVDKQKSRTYDLSDYEVFDFQGDYVQAADGTQWAEDRVDELQSRFQLLHGVSNAHCIEVGRLLKLTRHPREDQNAKVLITGLTVRAHVSASESGGSAGSFECEFSAIPCEQQFRPPRLTRKPCVQGPQTAVVVGPGGEEIYTDKYGRVKVQFHWDRYGKKNDKSSCWVRVSHPWAGKNFGAIHMPRIGQEEVVDFLEGDPDQPLITGRVYNAEQMPPWELPANATQSGILTRSSKGGGYGNANAIRFEDKAGAEQLWIHAEKNQDIEVENDETHSVGHDRTKAIGHDETSHIKHDRTETVDNNEKITIGVDRTESVGSNEKIDIGANRTETVGGNQSVTVSEAPHHPFVQADAKHEFFELTREEWFGPVHGPLWCAITWLRPAVAEGDYRLAEVADALQYLTRLALHVLPEPARFESWLRVVLARLAKLFPVQPEDPFADLFDVDLGKRRRELIARDVLDPALPYTPDMGRTWTEALLAGADPASNPFLARKSHP